MTAVRRPYWRRLIVPGLFTIISLAILISLGSWQLQRKAWKEGLIATLNAQMAASPAPLPPPSQWPALTRDNSEFRRVTLRAEFDRGREARLSLYRRIRPTRRRQAARVFRVRAGKASERADRGGESGICAD